MAANGMGSWLQNTAALFDGCTSSSDDEQPSPQPPLASFPQERLRPGRLRTTSNGFISGSLGVESGADEFGRSAFRDLPCFRRREKRPFGRGGRAGRQYVPGRGFGRGSWPVEKPPIANENPESDPSSSTTLTVLSEAGRRVSHPTHSSSRKRPLGAEKLVEAGLTATLTTGGSPPLALRSSEVPTTARDPQDPGTPTVQWSLRARCDGGEVDGSAETPPG